MARIRSIHPGLFTDESFVSASMAARLLLPGIWTEADDHGVFEWKPLSLKMRIFPADAVDVGDLLGELEAVNIVRRFSVDGREYGVVRNFCTYQRPKKPTYRFVLPPELETYAGIRKDSSEPVPHQSPTGSENPPQMEDGVGGGEEREKDKERGGVSLRDPPATRISQDWKPEPADIEWAKSEGLTDSDIQRATARFVDHFASKGGKDGRRTDWSAAWRNWCRDDAEKLGRTKPSSNPEAQQRQGFYAAFGSLELDAWDAHGRAQRSKPYPRNKAGGWWFPSQWPPGHEAAA